MMNIRARTPYAACFFLHSGRMKVSVVPGANCKPSHQRPVQPSATATYACSLPHCPASSAYLVHAYLVNHITPTLNKLSLHACAPPHRALFRRQEPLHMHVRTQTRVSHNCYIPAVVILCTVRSESLLAWYGMD